MEDRSHMDCKPDHELEKQTDEMRKKVKAMNVHTMTVLSAAGVSMSIRNDHGFPSHHITIHKSESFGSSFNSCVILTEKTSEW